MYISINYRLMMGILGDCDGLFVVRVEEMVLGFASFMKIMTRD